MNCWHFVDEIMKTYFPDIVDIDFTANMEKRLDDAHITCNKNTIPNEPRSPFVTSGVRLGTLR